MATRSTGTCFRGRLGHRRAFVLADAIIGLSVVLVLAATVAVTAHWERRAADGLADTRAATAAAEAALASGGRAVDGVRVDPVAGGAAVPGHRWVRATAAVGGHTVGLVGLVKEGAGR